MFSSDRLPSLLIQNQILVSGSPVPRSRIVPLAAVRTNYHQLGPYAVAVTRTPSLPASAHPNVTSILKGLFLVSTDRSTGGPPTCRANSP